MIPEERAKFGGLRVPEDSSHSSCPGLIWDIVSFHKKPGGDRAVTADKNRPNKYGVFDTMCHHARF